MKDSGINCHKSTVLSVFTTIYHELAYRCPAAMNFFLDKSGETHYFVSKMNKDVMPRADPTLRPVLQFFLVACTQ